MMSLEFNALSSFSRLCPAFAPQCVHAQSLQLCLLANSWTGPARLLCPWDSPGKNTGVGCRALLQGIFPTQGSNSCLLQLLGCRWILYR